MALSLYSGDCGSVADVNELFGSEQGLLVLRPGASCGCGSVYFTVPSGCYALVTRHGADLDYEPLPQDGQPFKSSAVWPAGLHCFYPPWVGVSHLVTKQSIVFDSPVKACKTKDNVTVNLDMALAFRIMGDEALGEDPELVRNFVYAVKPKGLEQQLRDAQEEAIRGLARSLKHTEIYGIRSGGKKKEGGDDNDNDNDNNDDYFRDPIVEGHSDEVDKAAAFDNAVRGRDVTELMMDQLNRQFMPQGIEIQSVMVTSVSLPNDITQQMSDKTMVISLNAAQRMTHENEMQQTRMDEKETTLMQTFFEARQQERSDGAEKLNAEKVKLNDAKSQALKSEANIVESTAAHIESLKADSMLEVQRVQDSMHATVTQISTEAEKESAELLANTELDVQTMVSSAELTRAKNEANAHLTLSVAEGKIAPWIEKKKAYETKMKKNEVYASLAQNKELIVVNGSDGDDGDMVNLVAVADSILSDISSKSDGDATSCARSKMVAEMAIMHSSSAAFMSQQSVV